MSLACIMTSNVFRRYASDFCPSLLILCSPGCFHLIVKYDFVSGNKYVTVFCVNVNGVKGIVDEAIKCRCQ